MSELSDRMIRDMELAGLVEGTRREYFRASRQLAAYYKISPDQLSERKVEDYIRMSLRSHESRSAKGVGRLLANIM